MKFHHLSEVQTEKNSKFSFLNKAVILPNNTRYDKNNFGEFEFSDGQNVENMPKPPDGKDYWKNRLMKNKYYDYKNNDIAQVLNDRINFLLDYYERFSTNDLTKEEINRAKKPSYFTGPYLTTHKEIKRVAKIDVLIDWTLPENHKSLEANSTRSQKYKFNASDFETLVNRWYTFQKEYRVFDLRPLLGIRCGLLYKQDDGELQFIFYRLLDNDQYKKFLIYMAKDLPAFTLFQIKTRLFKLCDRYYNGKFSFISYQYASGLEIQLMDLIYKEFNQSQNFIRCIELLIGKRSYTNYYHLLNYVKAYRHIPFHDGPWSKEEDLLLINNVLLLTGSTDLLSVVTQKKKIPWQTIFEDLKIRHIYTIVRRWHRLKQRILNVLRNANANQATLWTNQHTIDLIEILYEMDVRSFRDINWTEVAQKFPQFSDNCLYKYFLQLYKTRVPFKKRKYFCEAIEYLYTKVKSVYTLKEFKFRNRMSTYKFVRNILEKEEYKGDLIKMFFEGEQRDLDDEASLLNPDDESVSHLEREKSPISPKEQKVQSRQLSHTNEQTNESTDDDQNNMFIDPAHFEECKVWKILMDRAGFEPKINLINEEEFHLYCENPCPPSKCFGRANKNQNNIEADISTSEIEGKNIEENNAAIETEYQHNENESITAARDELRRKKKKKKREREENCSVDRQHHNLMIDSDCECPRPPSKYFGKANKKQNNNSADINTSVIEDKSMEENNASIEDEHQRNGNESMTSARDELRRKKKKNKRKREENSSVDRQHHNLMIDSDCESPCPPSKCFGRANKKQNNNEADINTSVIEDKNIEENNAAIETEHQHNENESVTAARDELRHKKKKKKKREENCSIDRQHHNLMIDSDCESPCPPSKCFGRANKNQNYNEADISTSVIEDKNIKENNAAIETEHQHNENESVTAARDELRRKKKKKKRKREENCSVDRQHHILMIDSDCECPCPPSKYFGRANKKQNNNEADINTSVIEDKSIEENNASIEDEHQRNGNESMTSARDELRRKKKKNKNVKKTFQLTDSTII